MTIAHTPALGAVATNVTEPVRPSFAAPARRSAAMTSVKLFASAALSCASVGPPPVPPGGGGKPVVNIPSGPTTVPSPFVATARRSSARRSLRFRPRLRFVAHLRRFGLVRRRGPASEQL